MKFVSTERVDEAARRCEQCAAAIDDELRRLAQVSLTDDERATVQEGLGALAEARDALLDAVVVCRRMPTIGTN